MTIKLPEYKFSASSDKRTISLLGKNCAMLFHMSTVVTINPVRIVQTHARMRTEIEKEYKGHLKQIARLSYER